MKVNIRKSSEVEVDTLSICVKVRDEFAATLLDPDGEIVAEYEGYVPKFMPGEHYGDYLMLDIDIETGVIKNWYNPDSEDIEELISASEE